MARITPADVAAWSEKTKLAITTLDPALVDQVESEVIARLSAALDTSTWVDSTSTPLLIRTAIAKKYFAILYWRFYSEDVGGQENTYADKIDANAELIISSIIDGSMIVPGVVDSEISSPSFYPTDASSAQTPTFDDTSLGPNAFSMGTVF